MSSRKSEVLDSFCPNQIKFQLKKETTVILHGIEDIEEWWKFKEKLIWSFKCDFRNLANFYLTTQKPGKIFLMGSFVEGIQCLSYKNTEELSFMILNSDAKFEKTLSLWFQK